jgi:hypothetical protein
LEESKSSKPGDKHFQQVLKDQRLRDEGAGSQLTGSMNRKPVAQAISWPIPMWNDHEGNPSVRM